MKINEILKIENLHLSFPLQSRKRNSLRDFFIQCLREPYKILFKKTPLLHVLRGVNLTVNLGDRIAILGVNGAGKTTLCRSIAGFYASKGSIQVQGEVRAIFDTLVGIYPELTGRENATILAELLYPKLKGLSRKIDEALEFSELGQFLDTPFKTYSAGMQTRLCLAVLTLSPTDLLILDEVFEGADQFFRKKIAARVTNIIESSGAVIFVSHSEDQVLRVCNRGVLLHEGRIAFDGPIQEALKFYREAYEPTISSSL